MGPPRAIAVDLGGTKLAAGVVDAEGAIVATTVRPTPVSTQDALVAAVEDAVAELSGQGEAALGLGIPSTIDQRRGRAVTSVNIPLTGIDFRERLSQRFGLPVALENDANAAALAEHRFGAGRGTRHMVMLTLGTGIGGGLILDGRLYRGATGAAGELGHIPLEADGPPCQGACPGRGHLEVLASGRAADVLARRTAAERPDGDLGTAAAAGRDVDARLAAELARAGDGDARDVLARVGFYLGLGMAAFVNVFNPERIVVGGGFAAAGDLVLEPARRVIAERSLSPARDVVEVVPAALGRDAGLIGAALVGLEALEAASGA